MTVQKAAQVAAQKSFKVAAKPSPEALPTTSSPIVIAAAPRLTHRWRQMISVTLSTCLLLSNLFAVVANAQSVFDVTPPTIEFEPSQEGVAGETQVFTVQVTDDLALKDVKLYYRFAGQDPYSNLLMLPLSETDYYTANVPTDETETRPIEYYIQARDNGGNRVIKGFAFEPFVRDLLPPNQTEQPQQLTAEPQPAKQPTPAARESGGFKWWYVALGVLATGAIAAATSGSGGGGETSPTTVPVTIVIPPPNQ